MNDEVLCSHANQNGTVRDGRKGSSAKAAYHVTQGLYHADANLAAAVGSARTEHRPEWSTFAL